MKKKDIKRRVYTSEFKTETVALAMQRNKPISKIALDLGINETMLQRWIQKYQQAKDAGLPAFPGHGRPQDEEEVRQQKESKAQLIANEIQKRSNAKIRSQRTPVKIYQFMLSNKNRYTIKDMARTLGVARSGYYKWAEKQEAQQ